MNATTTRAGDLSVTAVTGVTTVTCVTSVPGVYSLKTAERFRAGLELLCRDNALVRASMR